MTDRFSIIPFRKLAQMILYQLDYLESLFGIPQTLFFYPQNDDAFKLFQFGKLLENPLGVAAGPQTQLAHNIVAAWLCGARFIELKTIQTLDELDVSKPCIDMQDEGYNCEWSQELKIHQSFDQYLNAWILIHILQHKLGHNQVEKGFIFNMSVGYNMNGILEANVQWFFEKMQDASVELNQKLHEIEDLYPDIWSLPIDSCLSDTITLSTMHGCPPSEIEAIGKYLLQKKKLHTTIKLNPTLLGQESLTAIFANSGFDTRIPDLAFDHDLKFNDAAGMISRLQKAAEVEGLQFSLKLTNTLESLNNRPVFDEKETMMYMSGRALHPIAIHLAKKIRDEIPNAPAISFSGGVDVFNVVDVIECGLYPVTVCSDLLKPGGYGRLAQYVEMLRDKFIPSITSFTERVQKFSKAKLEQYALQCLENKHYKRTYIQSRSIKTSRPLTPFDCVKAPCSITCPSHQDIPGYLHFTAMEAFKKAYELILQTNPLPMVTGMACDHPCEFKCTRMDYDEPIRIRDVKRFIAEQGIPAIQTKKHADPTVTLAIIGAGPSGLACAYYAALSGVQVELFEASGGEGGMVRHAIPGFRLKEEHLEMDLEKLREMGIRIHYNEAVNTQKFRWLRENFNHVYISVGAQGAIKLDIPGADSAIVLDPLRFLRSVKNGTQKPIGQDIVVVGGGNTAMDIARSAMRLVSGNSGRVTIIYRRTIRQMPAEEEEIHDTVREGIQIMELAAPIELINRENQKSLLKCQKMRLGKKDASGRARPEPIEGAFLEIPVDTLIPALGQHVMIDFADKEEWESDPDNGHTHSKVHIGGDARRGAATIIQAIADGREVAERILETEHIPKDHEKGTPPSGKNIMDHMASRMKRIHKEVISEPTEGTLPNHPIAPVMTVEEAVTESQRCLRCDEICNICTTVCPNMALQFYPVTQREFPNYQIRGNQGKCEIIKTGIQVINQQWQIMHLADWCNACGNCNTFCPTNGAPYKIKPHIYFDLNVLQSEKDGYHFNQGVLTRIIDDQLSQVSEQNGRLIYSDQNVELSMDKMDFQNPKTRNLHNGAFVFNTEDIIDMFLIYQGAKYIFQDPKK